MMDAIKEESVGFLFNLEVQVTQDEETGEPDAEPVQQPAAVLAGAGDGQRGTPAPGAVAAASGGVTPVLAGGGLAEASRPRADLQYSAPAVDGEDGRSGVVTTKGGTALADGVVDATGGEPARNAPCPCGSGRKYKRCHGDPARRSTA